jgi:hypothetical protein
LGGTDPCLLSWELRDLCGWLWPLAGGGSTSEAMLDFLEPELTFEVVRHAPDHVELQIVTRYGMSRGDDGEMPSNFERTCLLRVSRTDLATAAADLAREAGAYPER